MKKILPFIFIGLGLWFISFFIFNNSNNENLKLNESAKDYLIVVVPKIIDAWSVEELLKEASPRLSDFLKNNRAFSTHFKKLLKLGKLRNLDKPEGNIYTVDIGNGKKETLGNYIMIADFQQARARINIKLILVNDEWKILVFNVFTPMRLTKSAIN